MSYNNTKKEIDKIIDDIYGDSLSYFEESNYGKQILSLLRKGESNRNRFIQNMTLLPTNAFIKKEFIKCGKQNCEQVHGPYYYGYWKDKETKKLRKKYLGKIEP